MAFEMMTYLEETSRVLISIVNTNCPAAESDVKANSKVSWLKWHLASILLKHHLPLQEGALHRAAIDFLWLGDQNRAILQEVVNYQFPDSVVLKS